MCSAYNVLDARFVSSCFNCPSSAKPRWYLLFFNNGLVLNTLLNVKPGPTGLSLHDSNFQIVEGNNNTNNIYRCDFNFHSISTTCRKYSKALFCQQYIFRGIKIHLTTSQNRITVAFEFNLQINNETFVLEKAGIIHVWFLFVDANQRIKRKTISHRFRITAKLLIKNDKRSFSYCLSLTQYFQQHHVLWMIAKVSPIDDEPKSIFIKSIYLFNYFFFKFWLYARKLNIIKGFDRNCFYVIVSGKMRFSFKFEASIIFLRMMWFFVDWISENFWILTENWAELKSVEINICHESKSLSFEFFKTLKAFDELSFFLSNFEIIARIHRQHWKLKDFEWF